MRKELISTFLCHISQSPDARSPPLSTASISSCTSHLPDHVHHRSHTNGTCCIVRRKGNSLSALGTYTAFPWYSLLLGLKGTRGDDKDDGGDGSCFLSTAANLLRRKLRLMRYSLSLTLHSCCCAILNSSLFSASGGGVDLRALHMCAPLSLACDAD
jgi:hypothetical protein